MDAAQPYVVVDVVPNDAQGQLLQVVARNIGQTMARNVQVRFDPPLPKKLGSEQGPFLALEQGISYLPPGRSMTWNLGVSFDYFEGETAPPLTQVTVTCVGPFGATDPLTYAVSFEESVTRALAQPGTCTGSSGPSTSSRLPSRRSFSSADGGRRRPSR